jgi:hypothetical protein
MKLNKLLIILLIATFFASCKKDAMQSFKSIPASPSGALKLSIKTFQDSSATIAYSYKSEGRLALEIFEVNSLTAEDTTVDNVFSRTSPDAVDSKFIVLDGKDGECTFEKLNPYTKYVVFGVAANADGSKTAVVSAGSFLTKDRAKPVVKAISPSNKSQNVWIKEPIVITYDENVFYDNTKAVTLTNGAGTPYTGVQVSVNKNVVTIKHDPFPYSNYVLLNVETGAFKDASGNGCDSIFSVAGVQLDEYFKTQPDPQTVLDSIYTYFQTKYTYTLYQNDSTTQISTGTTSMSVAKGDNAGEYVVVDSNFTGSNAIIKYNFTQDGVFCPYQDVDQHTSVEGYQAVGLNGNWFTGAAGFDILLRYYTDGSYVGEKYLKYTKL